MCAISGPGPHVEPDIDDVGFVSMAVKVLGVPGPKLMDDEKFTQDFTSVSTPTFVTPNTRSNAKLQVWSWRHLPVFYFFDPRGPTGTHILDFLMQGLWNETQYNPLGHEFFSCVPYLIGEGQAMKYSFRSLTKVHRKIPRVPFRPPDNYLRDNMQKTLNERDVEFYMEVQMQTDPHRHADRGCGRLLVDARSRRASRSRPSASHGRSSTLRSSSAFARNLTINPWHCIPEHRPLGNQSRARRRMYFDLARFRQAQNKEQHIEPTGDEVFE